MLLHDTFDYSAREHPTAEFAVQGTRSVSYAEAQALANQIANALVAKGLVPGDRVAPLSKNSIEHALWYYACSNVGVVPVPLNFLLDTTRAAYRLVQSSAVRRHAKLKIILSHAGSFVPYAPTPAVAYFTGHLDAYTALDTAGHAAIDRAHSAAPFPQV